MKRIIKWTLIVVFICAVCFVACDWDEEEGEVYNTEASAAVEDKNADEDDKNESEDYAKETEYQSEAACDSYPVGDGAYISFETVDINGNPVSQDMLAPAKLVMLNLWEPWCGPCVGEMPDLNKLYLQYKDKGLLIVGVYASYDMDSDARAIIEEYGISYPIIKYNNDLKGLSQNYVPATYLLDHNGNLITEEPYGGARGYSDWEEIISKYLN